MSSGSPEESSGSAVGAEIALAGPVAGGVAALSAAALYYLSHDRLFLALASTGFMLNLFNMIPLSPLHGR